LWNLNLNIFSDFVDVQILSPLAAAPSAAAPSAAAPSRPEKSLKKFLLEILDFSKQQQRQQQQHSAFLDDSHFFGIGDREDENVERAFFT